MSQLRTPNNFDSHNYSKQEEQTLIGERLRELKILFELTGEMHPFLLSQTITEQSTQVA